MSPNNTIVIEIEAIEQEDATIKEVSNGVAPAEIELVSVLDTGIEETNSPLRSSIGTYAIMTDPDEGTLLTFHRSQVVNGVNCAKIETQDVQAEIDC